MPVDPSPAVTAAPPGGAAVRRARPIYRVFVSSTWLDLQPERRALMEALNRMEEMRFVGMEFFGNRPDDTHDASIDQVDLCEVFIGIIGFRHGSGITEAEYRRARALGLPCFVYFKRGPNLQPELTDNDPALAAKLAAFKQELMHEHTVKEVGSPAELAASATADLHNWVAARWIAVEPTEAVAARARPVAADADRTNILRLLERIDQDWIKGVLEASLHHQAWLDLGLDWREDAVEHPWDRIVVAPNRPIQTLSKEDSITGVFDAAQHTLLVLGEPGAGKTTTVLELARDLIARARASAVEPAPVVLALSTWRGRHKSLIDWLVAELGLRYQVPKRVARGWLEEGRLVLILDGLDEVMSDRRAACVEAVNAFAQAHPPPGLAVTCRVAEYDALLAKLRLRSAICLQPLTPAQVDRYFQAAGHSLTSLRRALQDDAGLRNLARSPLMLSVMTMAWRDAPAETTAPFAAAQTPEELRRRLFDAYVQAALHRRGKVAGRYAPERTIQWLTWLARRMKEHGLTLFALEQLQPAWLAGLRQQFGYFMATRLLGTVSLVLPFVLWPSPAATKIILAGFSVLLGAYIGGVDFVFSRTGWGGEARASRRFFTLFFSFFLGGFAWIAVLAQLIEEHHANAGSAGGLSALYLFAVGFAFCTPLDVRALDVKPSASMRWAWRQALDRAKIGFVGINLSVIALFLTVLGIGVAQRGFAPVMAEAFGQQYSGVGLAGASMVIALGWWRLRPRWSVPNGLMSIALLATGAEVSGALGHPDDMTWWAALLFGVAPAVGIGVFGGFASTMIDPARGRRTGAWFWLRVPVLMFLLVGLVMLLPGFIWIFYDDGMATRARFIHEAQVALAVGAISGLAGFFRFGGFNGLQHGILRWLLVRSGRLPPDAEKFLDHAAQLALLQKVGFGYRFIHALLLDHFAGMREETK